jgi:hypothetical protein
VINSRWQFDLNALFDDLLNIGVLNPVFEAEPENLLVFDVVIMLRVVLENSRVRRNNLKLVVFVSLSILRAFFA